MLNFPNNPTIGEEYPTGTPRYFWDGTAWLSLSGKDQTLDSYELARVGQSLRVQELAKAEVGRSLDDALRIHDVASGITFNTSYLTGVVTYVPPTFGSTGMIQIAGVDVVLPRAVPVVDNELYVEAFQFGTTSDAVMIQAAVDYIEARGMKTLLKGSKASYVLSDIHTGAKPPEMVGKKQCILVRRPDIVWLDFTGATWGVESNNPTVAALDDVLAYGCSEFVASEGLVSRLRISGGGSWIDPADEPDYLIRADYTAIRYSVFSDVSGKYCRTSNLKLSGFVIEFDNCDMRNAQSKSNFELVVDPVDGGVTGAKTSILFKHCTADYAGLYGYSVTGGNGHTYIGFINSTGDHSGRTRSNATIEANTPVAASYFISGGFGIEMIACGSEFSTRALRIATCKGMAVRGLYCNGNGVKNGANARENILITGYSEDIVFEGYRENASLTQTYIATIEAPVGFHRSSVTLCATIADSRVLYIGGDKTVAAAAVMRKEDFYKQSMRCPTGGNLLFGKPLVGNNIEDFASQTSNAHEFDFTHTTDATGLDTLRVLQLVDQTRQGVLGVIVTVDVVRHEQVNPNPITSVLPERLVARASVYGGVFKLEDFKPTLGTVNEYPTVELYWSGPDLRIRTSEEYTQHHITVRIIGRLSAERMTYIPIGEPA